MAMTSEAASLLELEADAAVQRCLEVVEADTIAKAVPAVSPEVVGASCSPFEVVLRHEDKAEEWHFDEAVHNSKLEDFKAQGKAFKDREAAARDRAARDAEAAEQETSAMFAALHGEEQEVALELSGLRDQLFWIYGINEQLQEDTELEVANIEREVSAARESVTALEAELQMERESRERAKRRIQEIEDQEFQLMQDKRTQISKHRSDAQEQVVKIQRSADKEIQLREQSTREEVEKLQQRIDAVLLDTRLSIGVWQSRRKEACDIQHDQFMHEEDRQRLEASKKLGYILPRPNGSNDGEEGKMRNALALLGGQD